MSPPVHLPSDLRDRVVLVTGAATGIGRATAALLAEGTRTGPASRCRAGAPGKPSYGVIK